jgi:hypothetical protein
MAINPALATLCAAAVLCLTGLAISIDRDTPLIVLPAHAQQPQPAAAKVTAAGITLHSVSVELPTSDRMFPGGDADAINNNCLACHSAGMVLTQPALTRITWERLVDKMRKDYKAPVDQDDVKAIVDYLAAHKGAS